MFVRAQHAQGKERVDREGGSRIKKGAKKKGVERARRLLRYCAHRRREKRILCRNNGEFRSSSDRLSWVQRKNARKI